jgi:DNA-binding transcriptional ArsR family regulator
MEMRQALAALAALAQETRLEAFRFLVRAGVRGLGAGALAEALGIPPATLSFHLKELRGAGLVEVESLGRERVYRADFAAMRALLAFLTEQCCAGAARTRGPDRRPRARSAPNP